MRLLSYAHQFTANPIFVNVKSRNVTCLLRKTEYNQTGCKGGSRDPNAQKAPQNSASRCFLGAKVRLWTANYPWDCRLHPPTRSLAYLQRCSPACRTIAATGSLERRWDHWSVSDDQELAASASVGASGGGPLGQCEGNTYTASSRRQPGSRADRRRPSSGYGAPTFRGSLSFYVVCRAALYGFSGKDCRGRLPMSHLQGTAVLDMEPFQNCPGEVRCGVATGPCKTGRLVCDE